MQSITEGYQFPLAMSCHVKGMNEKPLLSSLAGNKHLSAFTKEEQMESCIQEGLTKGVTENWGDWS